jgi:hypothetical protein
MYRIDITIPDGVLDLMDALEGALDSKFAITLAGGFLRDTYGRSSIKDIDIMVTPLESSTDVMEITALLEQANIPAWFWLDGGMVGEYVDALKSRGVSLILMGECPILNNTEVQLIVYGKPMTRKEIAYDMDINICQIVGNSQGDVYATPAFMHGFTYKYLEVLQGKDNLAREQERMDRIGKKYPKFTKRSIK